MKKKPQLVEKKQNFSKRSFGKKCLQGLEKGQIPETWSISKTIPLVIWLQFHMKTLASIPVAIQFVSSVLSVHTNNQNTLQLEVRKLNAPALQNR